MEAADKFESLHFFNKLNNNFLRQQIFVAFLQPIVSFNFSRFDIGYSSVADTNNEQLCINRSRCFGNVELPSAQRK